ncbi:MAG: RNase adapter RapZ [Woeseiaceae bacterium]|nr:RNase adapter RapZ [Woeseiaceae bacterium]NIP21243.1 RNase adapter RapZ [Woeseiaceae bacterium]NIS90215.1 RNase adapter RapZ [Woeseiaceae bacterium]
MRLIVVSGLSGSGKSVALHVLEDLGYYCIDNLPAGLIKSVVDDVRSQGDDSVKQMAVGVDARNRREDLESLPELIEELRQYDVYPELLFLQSSDDVLLKRYSESRRRHPLAEQGTALRAAIANERDLLSPVVNEADLIIDTSRTSIYELADTIRERIDRRKVHSLSVLIESFGFKTGIPADADFVFDMRCLPNPYWTLELRGLTGQDKEVSEFLDAQEPFIRMYEDILRFLQRWIPEYNSVHRGYLTVAIGCTGGQHRSVYMTEKLAQALREIHDPILIRHSGLGSHTISNA